jgi:hypothetical protein
MNMRKINALERINRGDVMLAQDVLGRVFSEVVLEPAETERTPRQWPT